MINDNFNFKKLLKESIQERLEESRMAPSEDSEINTGAIEVIEVPELEDFKKVLDFPVPDDNEEFNAKKTKFIKTVIKVWNGVKDVPETRQQAIPKIKKYIDIFLKQAEEREREEELEVEPDQIAALKNLLGTDIVGSDSWDAIIGRTKDQKLKRSMSYINRIVMSELKAVFREMSAQ